MSDFPPARLCLVTPLNPALATLPDVLGGLLDAFPVASVRLAGSDTGEDALVRAADTLRPVCHARDVPLLVTDHFRLAARLGLDGVHLSDGARQIRAAREALGRDAIVGAHARASRHEGMTAAEIGADYVSFGPVADTGLGDGTIADRDLFTWWSEMIEVPVIAQGGLTPDLAAGLAPFAEFFELGEEIWSAAEGPAAALAAFRARIEATARS